MTSNGSPPAEGSGKDGAEGKPKDYPDIPGFEESMLCLSQIALHGIAVNGLLVWIDIQRRTVTAKEWKENAVKYFTGEEITDAKNILWDICDENVIGKKVNRQGTSKGVSEINDIEKAFNTLVEKGILPLFVATSTMVMSTPYDEDKSSQPALKDIEETVGQAIKKQNIQLEKKCDKVISNSVTSNKKIDDIVNRLEHLERSMTQQKIHGVENHVVPTKNDQPQIKFKQRPAIPVTFAEKENATNAPTKESVRRPIDPNHLWNTENTQTVPQNSQSTTQSNVGPAAMGERTWAQIVDEGSKPPSNQSWRGRQHVLYGTANEDQYGGSFSADVELVAYNVAKNITSADLCNWLSQRGLYVKDCTLLTTSEEARSLSFKVSVDPKDFERATKDTNLWPYRVGIRLYKNFNKNSSENSRSREQERNSQERRDNPLSGRKAAGGNQRRGPNYYNGAYQGWRNGAPTYQW